MRYYLVFPLLIALGACSDFRPDFLRPGSSDPVIAPVPRPEPLPLPSDDPVGDDVSVPVVEGDPTESLTDNPAPTVGDGRLGTTTATLGDATEGGFWLKTPLVSAETTGRVVYLATGREVRVTLIPSGGPAGGGSQISLAAMRLLDIPLTDFPELIVYSGAL